MDGNGSWGTERAGAMSPCSPVHIHHVALCRESPMQPHAVPCSWADLAGGGDKSGGGEG